MRIAALFPLLLLAACSDGAEAPQPAETASATPAAEPSAAASPELPAVPSLAGEWRVAGIDDQSLDQPFGIALSGDEDELWWEPRCAGVVRSYRITGTAVAFSAAGEGAKLPPGVPPPPVCTIAVPPELTELSRALDAATSVGRTPENGVLISGGGHSVLLFSQ